VFPKLITLFIIKLKWLPGASGVLSSLGMGASISSEGSCLDSFIRPDALSMMLDFGGLNALSSTLGLSSEPMILYCWGLNYSSSLGE
jgi:hypothetical protein